MANSRHQAAGVTRDWGIPIFNESEDERLFNCASIRRSHFA